MGKQIVTIALGVCLAAVLLFVGTAMVSGMMDGMDRLNDQELGRLRKNLGIQEYQCRTEQFQCDLADWTRGEIIRRSIR